MANRYWVGGTGNWNATNTTNWSATSGGVGGASIPTAVDNVFFDGNSNSGTGAFTVNVGATNACLDLNIGTVGLAFDGAMTLTGTLGINIAGSLSLVSTNLTYTATGALNFTSTTTGKTITTNGKTLTSPINFIGTGGAWTLQDALTTTNTINLTSGTLALGSYTLTATAFISSNTNTRLLAFGTGSLTITGSGTAWNTATVTGFSYTGTPTVNISNSTATATTLTVGAMTAAQALNFNILTGTYTLTLTTAGAFENLNFTGFNGIFAAAANTYTIYGNLTIPATGGTYSATAGTNTFTFASTSGTSIITTNGRTANFGISVNGLGSTVQLADAFIQESTQRFSLVNGVFDMATYSTSVGVFTILTGTHAIINGIVNAASVNHTSGNLTIGTGYLLATTGTYTLTAGSITINDGSDLIVGAFNSSNTGVRSIAFGTGSITVIGAGTAWDTSTSTNFSYIGTSKVNISNNSAISTTINTAFMTAAQAINFNFTTGTYTLAITNNSRFNDLSFVGFAGSVPLSTSNLTVYGNLTYGASTTSSATTGVIGLAGTSAKTITTNGAVIGHNIAVSGVAGTYTLQDAFTGTATLTLTAGTLSLGIYSLTVGAFASSGSTARTLDMGTNTKIILIGNSTTVWNTSTLTNFTLSPLNAPTIVLAYSGATGTRTINSGSTRAGTDAFSFEVSAGTDTVVFTSANSLYNLNFTGFSGTWSNVALSMYGSLILSDTMTIGSGTGVLSYVFVGDSRSITSNGKTLDFPITLSLGSTTPSMIFNDAFTQGSTKAFTINNGTLNINSQTATVGILTILTGNAVISNGTLNCASVTHTSGTVTVGTGTITSTGAYTFTAGTITINDSATITTNTFTSSGTAVRVIAFGTGQINITGNGNISVWDLSGPTNFSYTGVSKVTLTYSGSAGYRHISGGTAGEVAAINFNVVSGADLIYISGQLKNFNLTGFAGSFGTLTASAIFGNLVIPSGLIGAATPSVLTFGGTIETQILDIGGSIIKSPITIASTAGIRLASAFNQQDYGLTLTSGVLDLNGKTLTINNITTATGTKSILFNGGTIVCTQAGSTAFNNAVPTGFTTSAGTAVGTISMTAATAKTFVGGGSSYAAKLNQGGLGILNITGSNTFDDITNTVQPASVLFTAGTTTTLNNFSLSGTAGNLITIGSITAASHTLSKTTGTVTISNCSISRSNATGGATWKAPTNLGNVDGGTNTGWSFDIFIAIVTTAISNFFSFF